MTRYVLYPGLIRSTHDGQAHPIGARRLAELYGVRYSACVVYSSRLVPGPDDVALFPRVDGDYSLPSPPPAPEGTEGQMPLYRSHKRVRALKIAALAPDAEDSARVTPAEEGFAPFVTRPGWMSRFGGSVADLGYYVVYEDGFSSWSPTAAFDGGYSRIT